LIDVMMIITIAEVWYLYPRLDYKSWSNKTGYKTIKKRNFLNYDNLDLNLSLLWSPMRLLASCSVVPANGDHSFEVMTSPYPVNSDGNSISRFCWIFWLSLINSNLRVYPSRTKFQCQQTRTRARMTHWLPAASTPPRLLCRASQPTKNGWSACVFFMAYPFLCCKLLYWFSLNS
jgi:hypothetical protein